MKTVHQPHHCNELGKWYSPYTGKYICDEHARGVDCLDYFTTVSAAPLGRCQHIDGDFHGNGRNGY